MTTHSADPPRDSGSRRPVGPPIACPLARELGRRLRQERSELVSRWLERIASRVSMDPNHIFPTDELLDHVPLLIEGIADYIEDPAAEVTTDVPLVSKAMELGELRHAQRFEVYEILKEYEILGGVLFSFLAHVVDEIDEPCSRGELLECANRIFRSVTVIQQVTVIRYLQIAQQDVREREERLRGFNRALSHEVKNRLGTLQGAVEMLGEEFVVADEKMRRRFQSMALDHVQGMSRTTDNLLELSRLEVDARQQRNVQLREVIAEVKRQLRHFAEARAVQVRVREEIPSIEVPASVVELALSNYLSNAIKYHDPSKQERWVEVRALELVRDTVPSVVVEVADNGVGVPEEQREQLFQRFFRANMDVAPEVEGTGLGLSLVQEMIASVGGEAWADFDRPGETVFAFALPNRRKTSRNSADTDPGLLLDDHG